MAKTKRGSKTKTTRVRDLAVRKSQDVKGGFLLASAINDVMKNIGGALADAARKG